MKTISIVAAKTTQSGGDRQDMSTRLRRYALLLPLCVVGCYWAILIYYLGAQWSAYEQYNYGWAVPFLCLYLIWQRCRDNGTTGLRDNRTGLVVSGRVVSSPVVLWALALCALLYAPTRFLHEANPTWRLTSLLWTLEVIGITLLMLPFVLGAYHAARTKHHASGISAFCFSDFLFPILFFLVAVPWPSGLETFMVQSLMRSNVATTVELLGLFGIPAVQHANVIEVGTGVVGIDEACSGIRSLQATLMISLFLGELYRLTIRHRVGLVVLGFVLAFAFNVGRTLLLTGIASASGVGAVASWHDPAGASILVACFLCLWLIAWVFQKAESIGGKAEILKAETLKSAGQPISFSAFQRFSIFLIIWLLLVEGGTELWYRAHERGVRYHAEWSVSWPNDRAMFQVVEIPPGIRGQFRYDEGIEGRWQDANR